MRCLSQLPSPSVHTTNPPHGGEWIDLFTDGSCLWPHDRDMRLAAWSIVEAGPSGDVCASQVVWAGQLEGILQSAFRAELRAVCCAVRYALFWGKKVRIWCDCQSVVTKFSQLVYYNRVLKPNGPHFDLWSELLEHVERLGAHAVKITKVAAHQDATDHLSALESWAFQHNIVADRAARLANLQRDRGFWTLHRQHCLQSQWFQKISREAQAVILSISKKVVTREEVLQQDETAPSGAVDRVQPIMSSPSPVWDGFIPRAQLPLGVTSRFGHRFVAMVVAWFGEAVKEFSPGCDTSWLSIHQLYLDYQHQTGELGLVYQKEWKDPVILPGLKLVPRTFKRRSSWFGLAFRAILRAFGQDIPWMVTRPNSTMIALHTACVALPWPKWRLEVVEKWLMHRLPAKKAATRSGQDLVYLPPAKQDVSWPALNTFLGPICS